MGVNVGPAAHRLLHHRFGSVRTGDIVHDHIRSRMRESEGNRLADARVGAGDQRLLAFEDFC